MFEDMHSILEVYRGEARVTAFMRLGKIISTTDFGVNLQNTINELLALDIDATNRCEQLENEVCIMIQQLLTNMAIEVEKDNIYNKPAAIADIFEVLLDELDDFEDYETPLKIIESETPEMAIACVVGFIKAKSEYEYIDMLVSVYPTTIDKLRDILNSRELRAREASVDLDVDPILSKHCSYVLENIEGFDNADMFTDYGYLRPVDMLIANSDISSLRSMKGKTDIIAAALFTHYYHYDAAYEHIELVSSYFSGNDDEVHKLNMNVADLLAVLYKGVVREEA